MFPFTRFFLESPAERAQRKMYEAREIARRTPLCVPWTPDIKWAAELNIKADSFPTYDLFHEAETVRLPKWIAAYPSVFSPSKQFVYCVKTLKPGETLPTFSGRKKGSVLFDGPVRVPALHEFEAWRETYDPTPWMSLTPMEMLSLRPGIKRAKGHTVIAGLGLGWQLIEVAKRKSVQCLTLVEKSAELVAWLWPRIAPLVGKPVDVIVGDAYEELPKLTADVALIDIFPHYGNNEGNHMRFVRTCKNINTLWSWGTAPVRGEERW